MGSACNFELETPAVQASKADVEATVSSDETGRRSPSPSNPAPEYEAARIPGLDGLRGVAILCVLAVHTTPPVLESGFFGVDIFFVLSGFLITTLLLREMDRTGTIDLRQFYLRRAARILPAMGAVIVAVSIYALLAERERLHEIGREAVAAMLFYVNWVHVFSARVTELRHLWSLSIEEQFYLVWPGVLLACMSLRRSSQVLGAILAAGVIGPEIGRALLWPGSLENNLYFRTELRVDALSWGALAAWAGARSYVLRAFIEKWSSIAVFPALAVILLHPILLTNPWSHYYLFYGAFALVAVSSAIVIACVAFAPPRAVVAALEFAPLKWIGVISYGLYLWHWPVFLLIERHVMLPILAKNILVVSLSIAISALSFYFWERPFLRLKRHFQPRLKNRNWAPSD